MSANPARYLVIMGSGETSPTMVKTHRTVLEQLGSPPVPAVLLDTPFGFQENADDITSRAQHYFQESVGISMDVASFRSRESAADSVAHERTMDRLRRAQYVFAGPGSPSYALTQWKDSDIPDVLRRKLTEGGAICFASAAALTVGIATVPVYEIYKVGSDPHWLEGLDLLAVTGLRAAVIPHYNNAEGGNHDTRFCYLGERRLSRMEHDLPDESFVLGVDEHTGLVIDVATGAAEVVGLGVVTVRVDGRSRTIDTGERLTIADLARMAEELASGGPEGNATGGGGGGSGADGAATAPGAGGATSDADSPAHAPKARSPLLAGVDARQQEFDQAVDRRDAEAATAAILGLDSDLNAWAADTLQSDELDQGRAVLRGMIASLGDLAAGGLHDPASVVGPYVDLVLELRRTARADRRFADADALRDGLVSLGVEVMDTGGATEWRLVR